MQYVQSVLRLIQGMYKEVMCLCIYYHIGGCGYNKTYGSNRKEKKRFASIFSVQSLIIKHYVCKLKK